METVWTALDAEAIFARPLAAGTAVLVDESTATPAEMGPIAITPVVLGCPLDKPEGFINGFHGGRGGTDRAR